MRVLSLSKTVNMLFIAPGDSLLKREAGHHDAEENSSFTLFLPLHKPDRHIPQSLLHWARLICKTFRCCGMTELPV